MARKKRRRLLRLGLLLLAGWLALSYFVVRVRIRSSLEAVFSGEAKVGFAFLWPTLDATALWTSVEGRRFRIDVPVASADLELWGLFGGRAVAHVHLDSPRLVLEEGGNAQFLRAGPREGERAGAGAHLDPMRLPEITFDEPEIVLGGDTLFRTERASLEQTGEATFRFETGRGTLGGIPFEKLTARLMPREGHLIVGDLKLRAFNGILGGLVDVHTDRAGAFNGELEWHFVEVGELWRTYGLAYAEKRRGDLSGRLVFEADLPALSALKGNGTLRLERGRFYSPVSFRVFGVLGLPTLEDSWVNRGRLSFSFEEELIYIEEGTIRGSSYDLEGRGIIAFGGAADLEVRHKGTTLAVGGRIDDPTVTVLPVNSITVPFARLFRERIKKR